MSKPRQSLGFLTKLLSRSVRGRVIDPDKGCQTDKIADLDWKDVISFVEDFDKNKSKSERKVDRRIIKSKKVHGKDDVKKQKTNFRSDSLKPQKDISNPDKSIENIEVGTKDNLFPQQNGYVVVNKQSSKENATDSETNDAVQPCDVENKIPSKNCKSNEEDKTDTKDTGVESIDSKNANNKADDEKENGVTAVESPGVNSERRSSWTAFKLAIRRFSASSESDNPKGGVPETKGHVLGADDVAEVSVRKSRRWSLLRETVITQPTISEDTEASLHNSVPQQDSTDDLEATEVKDEVKESGGHDNLDGCEKVEFACQTFITLEHLDLYEQHKEDQKATKNDSKINAKSGKTLGTDVTVNGGLAKKSMSLSKTTNHDLHDTNKRGKPSKLKETHLEPHNRKPQQLGKTLSADVANDAKGKHPKRLMVTSKSVDMKNKVKVDTKMIDKSKSQYKLKSTKISETSALNVTDDKDSDTHNRSTSVDQNIPEIDPTMMEVNSIGELKDSHDGQNRLTKQNGKRWILEEYVSDDENTLKSEDVLTLAKEQGTPTYDYFLNKEITLEEIRDEYRGRDALQSRINDAPGNIVDTENVCDTSNGHHSSSDNSVTVAVDEGGEREGSENETSRKCENKTDAVLSNLNNTSKDSCCFNYTEHVDSNIIFPRRPRVRLVSVDDYSLTDLVSNEHELSVNSEQNDSVFVKKENNLDFLEQLVSDTPDSSIGGEYPGPVKIGDDTLNTEVKKKGEGSRLVKKELNSKFKKDNLNNTTKMKNKKPSSEQDKLNSSNKTTLSKRKVAGDESSKLKSHTAQENKAIHTRRSSSKDTTDQVKSTTESKSIKGRSGSIEVTPPKPSSRTPKRDVKKQVMSNENRTTSRKGPSNITTIASQNKTEVMSIRVRSGSVEVTPPKPSRNPSNSTKKQNLTNENRITTKRGGSSTTTSTKILNVDSSYCLSAKDRSVGIRGPTARKVPPTIKKPASGEELSNTRKGRQEKKAPDPKHNERLWEPKRNNKQYVENHKLDWKSDARVDSLGNLGFKPRRVEKKFVVHHRLQWTAVSKVAPMMQLSSKKKSQNVSNGLCDGDGKDGSNDDEPREQGAPPGDEPRRAVTFQTLSPDEDPEF